MKTTHVISMLTTFFLAGLIFFWGDLRVQQGHAETTDSATVTRSAVFAGGCFWCTESDFEKLPGVIEVISGYIGGHIAEPTYGEVSSGTTGYVEAVKVIYDPGRVDYQHLLDHFWRHVDPTDPGGQFVDRGAQYRSVIFYGNDTERRQAEASKQALADSGRFTKPIATDILPLGPFYIGTTMRRASMSTLFRGSRFSVLWTNSIQEQAGQVLHALSSAAILSKKKIAVCGPRAPKCAVKGPIPIWGICSPMVRNRLGCGIVSIPQPCGSFRSRSFENKGTINTWPCLNNCSERTLKKSGT